MKGCLILIVLLFVSPQFLCGQEKFIPHADWKSISKCSIKFFIPADFKEQRVWPVDSCVQSYRNAKTVINIDVVYGHSRYGSLKHYYPDIPSDEYIKTEIGGRSAEIITIFGSISRRDVKDLKYRAICFVPEMRKDGGILTIWTYSSEEGERKRAIDICKSVSFPQN